MIFLRIIFFVLILVFQVSFLLPAHSMPPEEVVNAARNGLKNFLAAVQPQDLKILGFLNQSEADNAELGEGFQLYTIHPDDVLSYRENLGDLSSMLIPTDEWQFIILTKGQAKSLLTVDLMGNRWEAVGIGGARLARQLAEIVERYPSNAGYGHKFIRLYQARSDFVEISNEGRTIGIIPLVSARIAMGLQQHELEVSDLFGLGDIISRMAPIVRKNVEAEK